MRNVILSLFCLTGCVTSNKTYPPQSIVEQPPPGAIIIPPQPQPQQQLQPMRIAPVPQNNT